MNFNWLVVSTLKFLLSFLREEYCICILIAKQFDESLDKADLQQMIDLIAQLIDFNHRWGVNFSNQLSELIGNRNHLKRVFVI